MKEQFAGRDFLLLNKTAVRLFHEVAKPLPIIDYHNHINPMHLQGIYRFENIYQLWIRDDPYKHRVMRMLGIAEKYITGNATDKEKFLCWSKALPGTIGNPIFHWSILELKLFFEIDEMLTEKNAEQIWDACNQKIVSKNFNAINLLKGLNVEMLCTSDDLLHDLSLHKGICSSDTDFSVFPSLRADSVLNIGNDGYNAWFTNLTRKTGTRISTLDEYKSTIIILLNQFEEAGCLFADHSLDSGFNFINTTDKAAGNLFIKQIHKEELTDEELIRLRSNILIFLGQEYAKRGWVMQLHIGALRSTSSRLRRIAGPRGGYACIGEIVHIADLCKLLDNLESEAGLPKTILYTLNPSYNAVFASLAGSFSREGVAGNIQLGPAWWYNDHYDGIREQLTNLANYSLLSTCIGMTTDSRSVLSFSRHEYYRRILCNLVGEWVEQGRLPNDFEKLRGIVEAISYYNIKQWIKPNDDEK